MTAPVLDAASVAAIRRSYVPAARWMRANGWERHQRIGVFNPTQRLSLEWLTRHEYGIAPYLTVSKRSEWGKLTGTVLMADVTSIRQAVDYLVDADVLPAELASRAVEYVPAVDWGRDRIGIRPLDGYDTTTLVPRGNDAPQGWEPLYRRIPVATTAALKAEVSV